MHNGHNKDALCVFIYSWYAGLYSIRYRIWILIVANHSRGKDLWFHDYAANHETLFPTDCLLVETITNHGNGSC